MKLEELLKSIPLPSSLRNIPLSPEGVREGGLRRRGRDFALLDRCRLLLRLRDEPRREEPVLRPVVRLSRELLPELGLLAVEEIVTSSSSSSSSTTVGDLDRRLRTGRGFFFRSRLEKLASFNSSLPPPLLRLLALSFSFAAKFAMRCRLVIEAFPDADILLSPLLRGGFTACMKSRLSSLFVLETPLFSGGARLLDCLELDVGRL